MGNDNEKELCPKCEHPWKYRDDQIVHGCSWVVQEAGNCGPPDWCVCQEKKP